MCHANCITRKDLPSFGAPARIYVPTVRRPSIIEGLLSNTSSYSSAMVKVLRYVGFIFRCKSLSISYRSFVSAFILKFPFGRSTGMDTCLFSHCIAASCVPVYPLHQFVLWYKHALSYTQSGETLRMQKLIGPGPGYSQGLSQLFCAEYVWKIFKCYNSSTPFACLNRLFGI